MQHVCLSSAGFQPDSEASAPTHEAIVIRVIGIPGKVCASFPGYRIGAVACEFDDGFVLPKLLYEGRSRGVYGDNRVRRIGFASVSDGDAFEGRAPRLNEERPRFFVYA